MKYSQYKFKFYLNANHSIYLNGILGQNHPHTWEITLDTIKVRNDFILFDAVEKDVEHFFDGFQDKDINMLPPFDVTNPTLENLCKFFRDRLGNLLAGMGWVLTRIEMSETPARSYIIDLTDEIDERVRNEERAEAAAETINAAAEEKLSAILGGLRP